MTWPHEGQKDESPDLAGSGLSGSEFGKRLNRYGAAKHRSLEQAQFIAGLGERRYFSLWRRVDRCADYLLFRHYFTVDELRLRAARFCQVHLLCPFCAIRRGTKALGAYLERWEVIRGQRPALRPFLVTLTVKDGPDLAERVNHLRSAHRKLWKRRGHADYRRGVMGGVAGGVWSYEMKRGRGSGQWHPHVHGIWLAESQPDRFALSAEWRELTGDSYIVDVRPIEGDPVDGFLEVFKYALKFSDMEPADTFAAYLLLKGERLLDAAGVFRGVEVPESLLDDPLDDLPFVDRFFRFALGRGYEREESRGYGGAVAPMQAQPAHR